MIRGFFFKRPKHLCRQIGIKRTSGTGVYLFISSPSWMSTRIGPWRGLTAYLTCLPTYFPFTRSILCRTRSCAATVIARLPYDIGGEIGSFGTNRPLFRCIYKAVSNCSRARARANTARFEHPMLDIMLH